VLSTTLSELLEERKKAKTRVEVVRMAEKYGVEVEKLESVARFVSSPSVEGAAEGEVVKVRLVELHREWRLTRW
jgi:crotonobetainyl-CoA:carnitine CoA-transferase CaiB-like acyl-CoA transferase